MAIYEDLEIEQGSSFKYTIDIKTGSGSVYDLSNHTIAAQMKKSYNSFIIAATFAAVTTDTAGQIQLSLTAAQTIVIKAGRYVFDVIMETPSGDKYRVVEGQITISPGVTTIA